MKAKKITKYLKLPFRFDEKKLVDDLSVAIKNKWIPHFNTKGYTGDWKAIALYAKNGNESNIFALCNEDAPVMETPLLKKCSYFKEIINSLQFPILSARLLKLSSKAEIKPHKDHQLGYEDHCFRLHIPITTNNKVSFILDNMHLKMLVGECWYTNVNYTHSVSNHGNSDRVHLVIDGQRNAWTDQLFFSLAPKESFDKPTKKESQETIKRMIEELKRSDLDIAKELIVKLKKEIQHK